MKKWVINLLRKKEASFGEKIIYFALHYLRYIVVITQIIVIFVFFYRIKIEQEIIDLEESIQQKEEIISITRPLIEEGKLTEFKANEIKKILNQQEKFLQNFNFIFTSVPQTITIEKIEFDPLKIEIVGKTSDVKGIKIFYEKIKNNKNFKNVRLTKVDRLPFEFEFVVAVEI